MTVPNCTRLSDLFAALLAAIASMASTTGVAEIGTELRGEITAEASWYPSGAAHTGQQDSFLHFEMCSAAVLSGTSVG